MDAIRLRALRLFSQRLAGLNTFKTSADVVEWLGAMQSQNAGAAKWGIGVRLPGSTVHDINAALNAGKIIRTHILRPTWHFVSAKDIHWMSELSRPALTRAYTPYCKTLGISEAEVRKGFRIIEKFLTGGRHCTMAEIRDQLLERGIQKNPHHLKIIVQRAEVEGILCNGKITGREQTFTLLPEWVPETKTLPRDEAIATLMRRYFTSHGPATLEDFVWWSGLNIGESKRALEDIKCHLAADVINGRTVWMNRNIKAPRETDAPLLHLLPPFDEYVVSYTQRAEIIKQAHYRKVITVNGIFSPTLMLNGEIIGKWRKASKKIDMEFFANISKSTRALFDAEAHRVSAFFHTT